MAETDIDLLYKRWGMLKTERSSWMPHWRELSDYTLPRAGRFFRQDRNLGTKRYNNIYDSTATRALRVLGAGLMGGATSPARPWFRYAVADLDLMKNEGIKIWLNDCLRISLNVLQKSNTYRTLQSMYEELGLFGTAANIIMDDYNKVICNYPSTCGEYAIAANYRGEVDTIYREFEKPVAGVVGEFGYKNCSNTVQQLYDRGTLDAWVPIIHAIEPRSNRDRSQNDQKNMAWKSCYFESTQQRDGKYLREGGMKQFRAIAPRWALSGGDIYGNSPGMEALGDTKQLQHEQLRKAEGIDFQTKPPLQIPSSLKNSDVNRFPGGLTPYDGASPGAGIRTLFDVTLNLEHLLQDIQDVRDRIRQSYYTDLFLMLSQDTGDKTATEVAELHEEKLLMLGPVLERLHNELFAPLIDNVFHRCIEANLFPPPPQELQGQELNIEFVSMLAQAQRAVETNSVDRFVNSMGVIAAFNPQVIDNFDADKWAEKYSDMLGIDPELVIAGDKVAMIRQQRAQAQEQAQKVAMAEQASKTTKNLAQSPTGGGNALSDVTNAFSGYSTPQSATQPSAQ